jgi:hypothetical protein
MDFPLQPMSQEEFATLAREFGAKVVRRNGIFWRRIRPGFYRPILPVQELSEAAVRKPFNWPCGYQHALPGEGRANSVMNFIVSDGLGEYSVADLGRRRRQLLRRAARQFQVKPLRDLREFKEQGFRAYRSFYDRTRYAYGTERKNEAAFHQWAETVFRHPQVILLGGYGPDGLVGVSRSYWVDRTLIYATLFCETNALKQNLGELMFHELRMLAAQTPQIKEIFVRNYQGGNSLDHYYLLRGCRIVTKPARMEVPALIRTAIKWFLPRQYALLRGKVSAGSTSSSPAEHTTRS